MLFDHTISCRYILTSRKRRRDIMASEIPPRVSATAVDADRISSLPDGVLCHILSFLPTEHSVRTRVLSTRWNDLFTIVPVLYFRYYAAYYSSRSSESDTSGCSSSSESDDDSSPPRTTDTQPKRLRRFLNFVDWVFSNYKSGHMVEFYFTVTDLFPKTTPLLSWISESVRRKAQKLVIDVRLSKHLKFPQCIFTCDSITWLKLSYDFILDVPEDVLLPRLRRVELEDASFVDSDSARRLFRSCPVLERLCLDGVYTGDMCCALDISVPTLKDLTLYGYRNFNLVLDVPNLKHFNYYGSGFVQGSFSIRSLKLLSVANISFETESSEGYKALEHLLNVICQVKKLHFSRHTLKTFQRSGRPFPLFCNLTTLEIVDIFVVDPEVLLDLLDRTPHLEILKFYDGGVFYNNQIHFSGERVPTCVSLHLKEVTFDYVGMLENEIKTVEYLLKNAKILKTLKISMKGSQEDEVEIRKELLNFPRGSRDCRIELNLYLDSDTDSD